MNRFYANQAPGKNGNFGNPAASNWLTEDQTMPLVRISMKIGRTPE